MQIRKFRKEDTRKVSNLIIKCLKEVNSKDYSKKIINFMCRHFSSKKIIDISKKRQIYVAVKNNEIIGTASLKKNVILSVFVNPAMHRKQIGKRLMRKIEQQAMKKGYKSVELPSSLTAFDFYKKLGYKKVREKYEKNFGKTIIMKKYL